MVRRLYRVDWIPDDPSEPFVSWAESHREAAALAAGKTDPIVEPVEMPLNMRDQLEMLRREAERRPRRRSEPSTS